MELWVRSQDKSILAKISQIHIDSKIIYANDNESSIWTNLGVYATKERCLEILDEIQKLICDSDKTLVAFNGYMEQDTYEEVMRYLDKNKFAMVGCTQNSNIQAIPLNQTVVYQMPEK